MIVLSSGKMRKVDLTIVGDADPPSLSWNGVNEKGITEIVLVELVLKTKNRWMKIPLGYNRCDDEISGR
jgi:hypothetical protein